MIVRTDLLHPNFKPGPDALFFARFQPNCTSALEVSLTLRGRERDVENTPQDPQEWGHWERGGGSAFRPWPAIRAAKHARLVAQLGIIVTFTLTSVAVMY